MRLLVLQLVPCALVMLITSADDCLQNCEPCAGLNCTRFSTDRNCKRCLRSENETCGTSDDVCEYGLQCISDKDGNSTCRKASGPCGPCQLAVPACPLDSRLRVVGPERGQCCPQAECECDSGKCGSGRPECGVGLKLVQLRKGTGQPGLCCDQFECRRDPKCDNTRCPNVQHTSLASECPMDSVRPEPYLPDGACCPVYPDCRCLRSICAPVHCSPGQVIVIDGKGHQQPGRCCDRFHCEERVESEMDCMVNGSWFRTGQEWILEPCQVCACTNGVSLCNRMNCPMVPEHCTWVEYTEGECCPVCRGCRDETGERFVQGQHWMRDSCTNCTCSSDSRIVCHNSVCLDGCDECNDSWLPETTSNSDDATEICPSIDSCPLKCRFGFQRSPTGCVACLCASNALNGPNSPDVLHQMHCDLDRVTDCQMYVWLRQRLCCSHCANGFVVDAKGCATCACARCPSMDLCAKSCIYGYITDAIGCSLCHCRQHSESKDVALRFALECLKSGAEVGHGEAWVEGCRQCVCEDGRIFCSGIVCPAVPAECASDISAEPGICCRYCKEAKVEAVPSTISCGWSGSELAVVEGVSWWEDSCLQCMCKLGHVMCNTHNCANANADGDCEQVACASLNCSRRQVWLAGECCPRCIEHDEAGTCRHVDVIYHVGEQFTDGPCRSCTCMNDDVVDCVSAHCPSCDHPVFVPFQCCPVCPGLDLSSLENYPTWTTIEFEHSYLIAGFILSSILVLFFAGYYNIQIFQRHKRTGCETEALYATLRSNASADYKHPENCQFDPSQQLENVASNVV